jgi:hypothetical protein
MYFDQLLTLVFGVYLYELRIHLIYDIGMDGVD